MQKPNQKPPHTFMHKRRDFLCQMTAYSSMAMLAPSLATAAPLDLKTALAPRIIGRADAPIHIAEYFSLSCGFCADFHINTYPKIKENWIDSGKARFEYRDFPLSELAVYAHALARAVPEAGYEIILDILFQQQSTWANAPQPLVALQNIGRGMGINNQEFTDMVGNRAYLEGIIMRAQQGANEYAINSTPSFVINGTEIITGNQSYDEFSAILARFAS